MPNLTSLWPLLDAVEVDSLCMLTKLSDCLRTILAGRFYNSSLLAMHPFYTAQEPFPGWHNLTQSERRVLGLMADGKNGPQIADMLYISPKTAGLSYKKVIISKRCHFYRKPDVKYLLELRRTV